MDPYTATMNYLGVQAQIGLILLQNMSPEDKQKTASAIFAFLEKAYNDAQALKDKLDAFNAKIAAKVGG